MTVFVDHPQMYADAAFGGTVGAGEAYIRGLWRCDDLTGLVRLFLANREVMNGMDSRWSLVSRPFLKLFHVLNRNSRNGSARNIAAHYDLGNDFFELMLDPTMAYSCGIFETPDATLEQASIAKFDAVCRKLDLQAGDRVVEIGTGWGGLAIHAAQRYGCHVTTTTISREQHEYAREKIARLGLSDRITLLLEDYRDLRGRYDKAMSIEMIEAVGANYLDTYLAKCSSLLEDHGAMLLQAITIQDQHYEQARKSVDFIQRFIFPGSFIPSVGVITESLRADQRPQGVPPRGHRPALRDHAAPLARALLREHRTGARARLSRQLRAAVGVLPLLLRGRFRGAAARRRAAAADQAGLQAPGARHRMMPGAGSPLAQLAALCGPDVLRTDDADLEPVHRGPSPPLPGQGPGAGAAAQRRGRCQDPRLLQ